MKFFLKLIGIISLVLLSLCFLLIIFLPTFLSTNYGKAIVLNRINKNIDGNVLVDTLDLSWLGDQKIENLRVTTRDGAVVLSAERLQGDFSPFTFLFNNSLRVLSVQNGQAVIATDRDGNTNIEQIFNKNLKTSDWKDPIHLSNVNIELVNTGDSFFLKSSGNTLQKGLEGAFAIDATYDETRKLQLYAQNFPVLFLEQIAAMRGFKEKNLLLNLLGEKINELNVETLNNDILLIATSPTLQAHLKGQLKKETLKLDATSHILLNLPKENGANLLAAYPVLGAPLNNLVAEIRFKDITIPFAKQNSKLIDGEVAVLLEPVAFERLQLEQMEANAIFQLNEETFLLKIEGAAKKEHTPLAINLELSLDKKILYSRKLIDQNFGLDGKIVAGGVPIAIKGRKEDGAIKASLIPENSFPGLDVAVLQKGKEWVGNVVVKSVNFLNIDELLIPFKATSDALRFDVSAYSKERKNLIDGSGIATNWLDLNKIAIETNADLYETDFLNSGHFFKGKIQTNLSQTGQFAANVNLTGSKQALVKHIEGAITGNRWSQEMAFNFIADDSSLKGALLHHDWNFTPLTLGMEGKLRQLPIGFLCPLIDTKICKQLSAIFGSMVDGDASVQVKNGNGLLSLNVGGVNGTLQLNGNVRENYLYLNDPLTAEVKITPELEKTLLSSLVPFVVPIVSAQGTIKAEIDPKHFTMPLAPFSLDAMRIQKGKVLLPTVIVSKKSQLGNAANLVGIHNDFEVRFTPLYFNLKKSVLELERMDMLLDGNYPIATWGTIDFMRDKLKISVGISSDALAKALNVQGLSKEYMLQVPLKGSISHPQWDKKVAAARISALVAKQKGGTQGAILGTVLEAVSGSFTEDRIPSPTTNPLPW